MNLTFSIFCGLPSLFLRNQHCLHISFFVWKPGVRNPDLCFSLSRSDETRHYPFSESKGPNFGPLLFASLRSSGKNISSLFRKQGSEFLTLALRSAEIVNKNLCLRSKFRILAVTMIIDNYLLVLFLGIWFGLFLLIIQNSVLR